ncbi:hypothetical protein LVQ78_05825 [Buttiauxella sp. A2-C2_NF]|uniref:hypothetical protein n=1 Tax=Buttiauxella ferragutiae TaxID=82989 RepID=UPI001E3011D6|nr:hypothetical protein [Buttiauxella ferragutiae]MCE0825548.1 hypothetical protein [Buttiauxella ferragutiae]
MITKNFRLNALANQYAAAVYNRVTTTSNGEYFILDAGGEPVRVDIVNGIQGIRPLVDSYLLEPLKGTGLLWENFSITLLSKCVNRAEVTEKGWDIWQSMVNDMGASLADNEEAFHA